VVIRGLSLRYKAHSPLVLKSVSMSIEGGSKVAICGRTGCGKSSLFAALARLYPVAKGSVVVDGVDLVQVRLSRSRMLTYAHVCSRMLTYAHVCSRMLTYAHVCCRNADVC
jgi:ABC-type bacteriocin/lantibiotic exporter with double-glycine peptidase domain